jgi:hypothetical protein
LLADEDVRLVKGFYARVRAEADGSVSTEGGWVTRPHGQIGRATLEQFVREDGHVLRRSRPVPTHERPPASTARTAGGDGPLSVAQRTPAR